MRIEIQTNYFPILTRWHIRKALKWIPPGDLDGLECIRLRDYEPDDPEASKQPAFLTGYLYNGYYFRGKKGRSAAVAMYTRDLYFPIPSMFVLSPLAGLRIAERLAHEVGHHVLATRGFSRPRKPKHKPAKSQLVDPDEEAAA